jgi:hypothetical protein
MYLFKRLALLLFVFIQINSQAQHFTVSGFLTDKNSGEVLIGAYVFCPQTGTGAITNNSGYYALSLPYGTKNIMYLQEGYFARIDTTLIHKNKQVDVSLKEMEEYDVQIDPFQNVGKTVIKDDSSEEIDETEVEEDTLSESNESPQVTIKNPQIVDDLIRYVLSRNFKIIDRLENGYLEIPGMQISKMPSLAGEIDVVRSIKHLPGIMPSTELSSNMFVRGGNHDQNLVLLDGMPIYNMNHLFSFYSIFNAEAINSINVTKSGFASKQGGRLSAITDITTKEGNKNGIHGIYQNSLLALTLNLDGPLSRDGRTSFSIAARRSYFDLLFLRPFNTDTQKSVIAFYDLSVKVAHRIDQKNKLIFNVLSNRDRIYDFSTRRNTNGARNQSVENYMDIRWGNFAGSAQWNRVISEKLFSTAHLIYSQHKSTINFGFINQIDSFGIVDRSEIDYLYKSLIRDYTFKYDFNYLLDNKNTIHYGLNMSHKRFIPGRSTEKYNQNGVVSVDTAFGPTKALLSNELAVYIEDEYKLNDNFKTTFGLRGVQYMYKGKTYLFLEPRISFNSKVNNRFAFKGSYTMMNQSIHLLSDNTNQDITLELDRWVPATEKVRPQRAHQFNLGFVQPMKNNYEFNVDAYYKILSRVNEFKEGFDVNASALNGTNWEDNIIQGKAWCYGVETFLHKRKGIFTGWLSYSLAWAKRNTPGINRDNDYYFNFDRRHYINFVAQTELNEDYSASMNIVFSTGNVQSVPVGKYVDPNGRVVFDYPEKNNYRLANTVRIDFGFTRRKYRDYDVESGYKFSIYNVFARNNPAYIYLSQDPTTGRMRAFQRSYFMFIPGITYYTKF